MGFYGRWLIFNSDVGGHGSVLQYANPVSREKFRPDLSVIRNLSRVLWLRLEKYGS